MSWGMGNLHGINMRAHVESALARHRHHIRDRHRVDAQARLSEEIEALRQPGLVSRLARLLLRRGAR